LWRFGDVVSVQQVADRLAASPEFSAMLDLVAAGNPLQRKRILGFLASQDDEYWTFVEQLSATLNHTFLASAEARLEAANAYNRMCMDILREQIRFKKTGAYLIHDAPAAYDAVYDRPDVMGYYIVGLLLSYMFWPNHYRLFRFFRQLLDGRPVRRYLEVGAGHGLFVAETMRRFPDLEVTVLDISETSIAVAREMLRTFRIDPDRVTFLHGDFLRIDLEPSGYDLIVMGEVLEHVNEAPEFMRRARQLMAPGGRVFMTTCANCPAVDHVYRFHNVAEIIGLIRGAGLEVEEDLTLAAEDVPMERWEDELVTINYAGVLSGRSGE
jgi:2-polyprenyl-3-methyl-5-hydroxy-6-metoxy-1,4-benzoquinol methylase